MNCKCSISLIPKCRSIKPLPIKNRYLNCYVIGGVMCLLLRPIAGLIRLSVSTSKLWEFRLSCLIFSSYRSVAWAAKDNYRQI